MYYLYFNWQANGPHIRIHYANCGFCNNGNGRNIQNVEAGRNGVWIGPFTSFEFVSDFIELINVDFDSCRNCNP